VLRGLFFPIIVASSIASSGCAKRAAPAEGPVGVSTRAAPEAVDYAYDSLDARRVNSAAMLGKPTVLAFVTTWDLSSQAQVDFLVPMHANDGAKVNYVMVALQEIQDRELVEAFRSALKVTFPVALADRATIGGGGVFGDVHNVPTVVILDRQGRVVWRRVGLAKSDDIRAGMKGL
jgi:hypothetical protein